MLYFNALASCALRLVWKYVTPERNADLSQRFHFKTRKQELNSVEGSEYSTIRQGAHPPFLI
jgi:hypothetical protein